MNTQSIKQRYGIIGRSEKLDRAITTAIKVASTDLTVLIEGESGVGKEVFSKIIHGLSKRKHNNFIAINCGAIPEGTINSELFGHEKGAFTGAVSDRKGYFETVNGGTIFLDEIGEMPLETQSYLLRVLESGEFIKVGSSKVKKTDVRVIAATNADLENKIRSGKFREDLYYRLSIVPIHIPALHERVEDIYTLFRKFSIDIAEKYHMDPIQLDETAKDLIMKYRWPGNIRELKNFVEQLSILSEKKILNAIELLDVYPKFEKRYLPSKSESKESSVDSYEEKQLLYKLLFDMKADLGDMKGLIGDLIKTNNLQVPNIKRIAPISNYDNLFRKEEKKEYNFEYDQQSDNPFSTSSDPIIIDHTNEAQYQNTEIVEDNFSLEDMEKEMIKKALDKHNNKRKHAAKDLGISERTLYRKIKTYGLDD